MSHAPPQNKAPVIDLFTGRVLLPGDDKRIIRLAPENDGLGMLYGNDANPGKLYSIKIIGWGLQNDGKAVGLVPWLNEVSACPDLADPLNGHWEGYYNAQTGHVFYDPPPYKCLELEAAQDYYQNDLQENDTPIQEIPDTIGTHAVFSDHPGKAFFITEIFSWQLQQDGLIKGMLVDKTKVERTPVLLGDQALYSAQGDPSFKYFFQYCIANKLKTNDPEALEAMSLLMEF